MHNRSLMLSALPFFLTIAFTLSPESKPLHSMCAKQPPALSRVTEEEYALLSALIDGMYSKETEKLIVVQGQTTTLTPYKSPIVESLQRVKQQMPALDEETLKDFESKNRQPYVLQELFKVNAKYTLISPKKVGDYFRKDGGWWPAYYKDYPGSQGLMIVSRVGFNSEMTQALVYVSNQVGGLAGEGSFVLLVKDQGGWKRQEKVPIWIS